MNIIFLGPAGSGKGTQAVLLSKYLNTPHISIGNLLKAEVRKGNDFGKKVEKFIKEGKMVPDKLVNPFIRNILASKDCDKGFILDGFPRNLKQAIFLDEELKNLGKKIDKVFVLEIPEDVVIKRTIGRFKCGDCGTRYNEFFKKPKVEGKCDVCGSVHFVRRVDDRAESVIHKRIEIYNKETKNIINYYDKKGLLYKINGVKDVESIALEIKNYVR